MRSLRRAAARLRDAGSIPVLAALLLIAASAPLAAGERSRPNDSSERTAQPRGADRAPSSPPPSYSPPPSSGGSGSGGSEPRTAVPRDGGANDNEPRRQRPHGTAGGGGGGDWRGGGWYGRHYYPGFYPYYGYWGWGWGSWWWDDYYSYGWGPGYHYQRNPWRDRYYDRYGTTGALDIDVSPGKTEVWIDGRYVGTADDFDGFPQYLWLDRGVYDLALYRDGYKTIARQITIRSGQVISIEDRMQPGDSVRPEDLATKTHERRDERIRSEEERRDEIARRGDDMDDWRERARRRMEERGRYEDGRDERTESDETAGRLRLDVEPEDASVYLDGRFVGTGTDLQRLRSGLRLEPGEHRIAVVRPGRKAEEQEFTVAAGEEVELEFDLESME